MPGSPLYYDNFNPSMAKDERYVAVKRMIDAGDITRLDQCFRIIPKTVVASDLKEHQGRFSIRMANGDTIKVGEVRVLSELFNVDVHKFFQLIINQLEEDKNKK
jgi:hypothetical protein